jgi:hypothetical protein
LLKAIEGSSVAMCGDRLKWELESKDVVSRTEVAMLLSNCGLAHDTVSKTVNFLVEATALVRMEEELQRQLRHPCPPPSGVSHYKQVGCFSKGEEVDPEVEASVQEELERLVEIERRKSLALDALLRDELMRAMAAEGVLLSAVECNENRGLPGDHDGFTVLGTLSAA